MIKTKTISAAQRVIDILPTEIAGEITRLALGRRGGISEIREIRVRSEGVCSILIGNERIRLYHKISRQQTDELVLRLTGGGLYAHRDSIASGYITMDGGVRVGLCGSAAYEENRLVGVGSMRSLVFRIPVGRCDFADEIYSVFTEGVGNGMLIYSPPGVGKTTALRSLAMSVGSGSNALRVAVVDERCEFNPQDYSDSEVDILRGYKRREGVEIATRTLSSQVVMIDELGADDVDDLIGVVRCGIPLIATAHALDFNEIRVKPSLKPLFDLSVFSVLVGISYADGEYKLRVDRI